MTPSATTQNTGLGIWLMIATSAVFALQDGISRHLAAEYNVTMVVMIRFWVFALFVIVLAARAPVACAPPQGRPHRSSRSCAACFWQPRSA